LPPHGPYALSLHDALPIWVARQLLELLRVDPHGHVAAEAVRGEAAVADGGLHADVPEQLLGRHAAQRGGERGPELCPGEGGGRRSEEHTSELQSRENLVCR